MRLFVGTSGFAYKEWVGAFYPEGTRDKGMLAWYAGQFSAVEINNTFHRFPTAAGLAKWAGEVPAGFRFAIKVPQRITHFKRLQGVDEDLAYLTDTVATLGSRQGPLLFQLPPRMAADVAVLEACLAQLPGDVPAAFEFRHSSWFTAEVFRLLERHGCALCHNDTARPAPQPTADWGYVRLRRDGYSEAEMAASAEQVLAQPWREAYVFLKHEAPDVPVVARRWAAIAAGGRAESG